MTSRSLVPALALAVALTAACRFGGPSGNPSTPLDLPDLSDASDDATNDEAAAAPGSVADASAEASSIGDDGETDGGETDGGETDGGETDGGEAGGGEADAACCSVADGNTASELCDACP
jgi:hypothetical protein